MFDNKPSIAFKEATRETPDRLGQTLIIVPLSIGVGFCVLVGGLFVCWGLDLPADGAKVAGGLATSSTALYGWWCIWRDRIYMTFETITGHDLDGDGFIGEPPSYEFSYRMSDHTTTIAKLGAPEPVIRQWATAALNGGSLSYSSWQKRFATRSNYSDGADRYRQFREALVRSGWAIEQGTHSITLTEKGEYALGDWLEQRPEPTPLLEG